MLSVSQPKPNKERQVSAESTSPDVQIVAVRKTDSLSLTSVMQQLHVVKHVVKGDGSCLYHAVAHQAGFISRSSQASENISLYLRKVVVDTMSKHPSVRQEIGMSNLQWLHKQLEILKPSSWGGDLEVRLLAIGLQRDVVVVTATTNGSTFARKYPSQPPPVTKMAGGVFIPLSSQELCNHWQHWKPTPLLIIFNGINHFDSTLYA